MRDDLDEQLPGVRRDLDEQRITDSGAAGVSRQSPETLKAGYSWRLHLQNQHPGYELIQHDSIPWVEFEGTHDEAKVALVTTAGVYGHGQKPFGVSSGPLSPELVRQKFIGRGDSSFRRIPASEEARELFVAHPFLEMAGIEEDLNVVFPLERMGELEEESFVATVAENNFSFMGYLPYPKDLEGSLETVVANLKDEEVDLVLLTPGEALSHQTMVVIQRAIEAAGICTVSITLCRDVTEQAGAPRSVHYRFPFGFTLGGANDSALQLHILKDTIRSVEQMEEPGTVIDLPYEWVD
jgi:D-proline reductase (dithiol) PrdB